MTVERRERIRALNDQLRRDNSGGRILITDGVTALGEVILKALLIAVQRFEKFDEDNDPYGEHDFGAVTIARHRFFWKIDYYDPSMTSGAVDPADAVGTVRVLTLMLAEEY
ncbi:MAG: DUF3768 domain-containing protein [Alphaproteobacteria bacterium]|nr:MAG: DUF3768 domain-containing protein [Alphaproteobacteria bacterium]